MAEFVSLNGTTVNCAGGVAFEDAGWITCEETVAGPSNGFERKHGYAFLVPAAANEAVPAVALVAMGRFAHEAVAVDPRNGIVYETEDAGDNSGFYRFIASDPTDLTAGGRLQILSVTGRANYDTIRNQRGAGELLLQLHLGRQRRAGAGVGVPAPRSRPRPRGADAQVLVARGQCPRLARQPARDPSRRDRPLRGRRQP